MNAASAKHPANASRPRLAGALLLTAIIVGLLANLGNLENRVYDWFQQYQYQAGSTQILLITVDSSSAATPDAWSAEGFGAAVDKLSSMGAKAITATQPLKLPEVPPAEQIAALAELEKQATRSGEAAGELKRLTAQLAGFRKNYDDQQLLTRRLKSAGNVVLPLSGSAFSDALKLAPECAMHSVNQQGAEPGSVAAVAVADIVVAPPAQICDASRAVGYSEPWRDQQSAHATRLLVDANGVLLPSLSMATLAVANDRSNQNIVVASTTALTLDDRVFHTGPGFEVLSRFYNNRGNEPVFSTIAFSDLLAGNVDPAVVQDKIVLVGDLLVDESSQTNELAAPLLLTATTLSNLLEGDYVLRPTWLRWLEYAMLVAILLIVVMWLPAMPLVGASLVGLVLATIVLSIEAWLLVSAHIWVQLGTASLFAALAVWIASTLRGMRPATPVTTIRNTPVVNKVGGAPDELDLQFSVLRQQPLTDDTKEKMYQIAFHHGRAEEFAKAERVLRYIFQHDPDYKDVARLLEKLSGQKHYTPLNKATQPAETRTPVAKAGQKMLGRYTIERKLGEGAMATVYLAQDSKIGRKVAIKTVALAEEFDDAKLAEARQQFMREAESAGRLNHPNIIAIYDVGEDSDVSYLAMEYFDGVSLLKHAQPDDLLPASWVLELMARAADALDYAHRQGVVHRDIKPANLMYHATSDELKITDFGIARLTDTSRTKTGIILGTPSFMSPEQLMASGVTGQSDLYSLGVTLYQLLTGMAPFRADSIPKLMDKIMREDARPVTEIRTNLPKCVDSIIRTALAKNPEDRYSSGRAMAMSLRECAKDFGSNS